MTDNTLAMGALNAAQQIYLPLLHAKIQASQKPRAGYVPTGTPPRQHWITDRAARKAAAKAQGLRRFQQIAADGVPDHHLSSHKRGMAALKRALSASR